MMLSKKKKNSTCSHQFIAANGEYVKRKGGGHKHRSSENIGCKENADQMLDRRLS